MKANEFYVSEESNAIPIIPVIKRHLEQFFQSEEDRASSWLQANQFEAATGEVCILPDENGQIDRVYLGMEEADDNLAFANAALKLPAGDYRIKVGLDNHAAVNWALAQYRFSNYKTAPIKHKRLQLNDDQHKEVTAIAEAIFLVRDLVNTPTNDMAPVNLSEAMQVIACAYDADFKEIVGDDLLKQNFPAIHAVGRASVFKPRLLELHWGEEDHPLVSLVGKGVCFDSGGLDLKPASNMRLMKKDMGGAAHVLGLAQLIMQMKLPVRLQVLIPAVENAVSANAYRPGDVIATRKGLTVEIGNTDAEGRVVLADALAYASEFNPELIIDFATLTGAARVAVGTDIAAMFCNDDSLAKKFEHTSNETHDPLWRLPLHRAYLDMIKPMIADLSNSAASGYAGAITAALFLEQFVGEGIKWAHFDVMAWNTANKPGKPEGGEALAIRATYRLLTQLFS